MRMKRILCLATLLCLLASAIPTGPLAALASAKYYITVDLTNQIVTVYKNGDTSEAGIVRQMICSTGKSGTPTPTGTYTLPSKRSGSERKEWYYFPKYKCYAKWATRIVGGILFHSVLYTGAKKGPTRSSVNALGSKASHGCVRLRVDDAKWIAKNCPAGTKCKIYKSGKTDSALRKKLKKKTFSVNDESYDSFMGRTSKDADKLPLSKGSKGTKVKQLQQRLKALGFLNGSVDSKFGSETATAVKNFEAACGQKKTGKVNESLWKRIFAENAPTGTYVTLSKDMSGPAVAVLQRALADLKLFEGAADGKYSEDTVQAVKDYQRDYGFAVNGKASQALQKDAIKRAAEVKARYGDSEYRRVTTDEEVSLAKTKGKADMRAKAKKSAKKVATLKKNTEVEVLSKSGSWTKVKYDRKTGYIKTKSLKFYTGTRTAVSYEPVEGPSPSPSSSPEVSLPSPSPSTSPEVYLPPSDPGSGDGQPGDGQVGDGQPGDDQVGDGQQGDGQQGDGQQVGDQQSDGQQGDGQVGDGQPGDGQPGDGQVGDGQPGDGQQGDGQVGDGQPGDGQQGDGQVGDGQQVGDQQGDGPQGDVQLPDLRRPAAGQETAGAPKYALALRDGAQVYAEPQAEGGTALAELAAGAALEVVRVDGDWVCVRLDEATGYIPAGDVRLVDELPEAASAESDDAEPSLEMGTGPAPEEVAEPDQIPEIELEPEPVEEQTPSGQDPEIKLEPEPAGGETDAGTP